VAIEQQVLAAPGQQISLTDPDSRSMATSGRDSGVVGYNVQTAVDTKHRLLVAHEETNVGNDRAHLSNIACQAKAALGVEKLEAVADRGYFDGEDIGRRSGRNHCDAGEAAAIGREVGRPLWQAEFCLFSR
jgi:hypothetical protein